MEKAKIKKDAVKIDDKCKYFIYRHCILTSSAHGCSIVQKCDMSAKYCKRGEVSKSTETIT